MILERLQGAQLKQSVLIELDVLCVLVLPEGITVLIIHPSALSSITLFQMKLLDCVTD